jgi:hypothetical protein
MGENRQVDHQAPSRADCRVLTNDQRAPLLDCLTNLGPGIDLSAHKYILSDGIVLWRAWILWDRRVVLFILPFLSLVCTLGEHAIRSLGSGSFHDKCFSTVATIVSATCVSDGIIINSIRVRHTGHAFTWTILGLTVCTNLWATSLMFIRAWYVAFDPIVTCYVLHGDATSFKGNTDASCVLS